LLQHRRQVNFCASIVLMMELNFCHAHVSFEVLGIMLKGLLILFECLLEVFLDMFNFSLNEAKITFQIFYFLSESSKVSLVWSSFKLENLLTCLTKLSALFEISPQE